METTKEEREQVEQAAEALRTLWAMAKASDHARVTVDVDPLARLLDERLHLQADLAEQERELGRRGALLRRFINLFGAGNTPETRHGIMSLRAEASQAMSEGAATS